VLKGKNVIKQQGNFWSFVWCTKPRPETKAGNIRDGLLIGWGGSVSSHSLSELQDTSSEGLLNIFISVLICFSVTRSYQYAPNAKVRIIPVRESLIME